MVNVSVDSQTKPQGIPELAETLSPSHGLITWTLTTSTNALLAARSELAKQGVTFQLQQMTTAVPQHRPWYFLQALLQDFACLNQLLTRDFSFLMLNPAAGLMRRPYFLALLIWLARKKHVRLIARWGNCGWILRHSVRAKISRRTFRRSCCRLNAPDIAHLALTPQAAHDLKSETGITNFSIIHNCQYLPARYASPSVPDDPPLIVNVASVQPRKGPDLFVDVAIKVCHHHPTVKFVWLGGFETPDLTRQIRAADLHGRIHFLGAVYPPYEWLRRSSAMLFTSRSEAFGLAVAEAMACYRTVCCFANTGAAFAVHDTGIVVPRFDTNQAADYLIEHLRLEPEERVNHRAHSRYQHLFSPRPFAQRLAPLLAEARPIESFPLDYQHGES